MIKLGSFGEQEAVQFLTEQGFKILERNYKVKYGEIDIIALDEDTVCFIEVKTRKSLEQGMPFEAVSRFKQYKLSQVALTYLMEKNWEGKSARFDVVSLILDEQGEKQLELIKNAFDLSDRFYQ